MKKYDTKLIVIRAPERLYITELIEICIIFPFKNNINLSVVSFCTETEYVRRNRFPRVLDVRPIFDKAELANDRPH